MKEHEPRAADAASRDASAEEIITSCEVGKDYLGREGDEDEGLTCFDCARFAIRAAEAAAYARAVEVCWLVAAEAQDGAHRAAVCAQRIRALVGTAPTAPPDRQTDRQESPLSPLEKIGKETP